MVAHDFILDTGAEVCIVGASGVDLLTEMGTLRPLSITGVGGERTLPLDAGLLVVAPAKGATQLAPGHAAPPGSTAGLVLFTSLCAPATAIEPDAAAVLAATVYATAFPPALSLGGLSTKFNLPLGISSGLQRSIEPGEGPARGIEGYGFDRAVGASGASSASSGPA